MNKDYLEMNKKAWNQRTKIHVESSFYDVEGFLNGKSSLNPIELDEVGGVQDKSLLHLQCHFGLDTLSWARSGAQVTGVDLSSDAIDQAKQLAKSININAEFICQDVIEFGATNTKKYDLVYTSYGVLCWLQNLDDWASVISKSLKPGGQLNLIEFHMIHDLLSGYSYFPSSRPDIEDEGTYTENCDGEKSTMVTWPHSLSEILNALINNGLRIESYNEFPYSPYDCFEGLEKVKGKGYQLLSKGQQVPLVYSIRAIKI